MTNIELRACPCCGGKGELGRYDPYDGYQGNLGRYFVSCTACGLETPRTFRTKEDAAEVWNERATPDDIVRCGECIHRIERFRQSCIGRPKDWFCADGVRRR